MEKLKFLVAIQMLIEFGTSSGSNQGYGFRLVFLSFIILLISASFSLNLESKNILRDKTEDYTK